MMACRAFRRCRPTYAHHPPASTFSPVPKRSPWWEQAGPRRQEQRGRTRIYRIDRERLTLVSEWLAWFGVGSPPS
jgi:hypothetical protein